MFLFFHRLIATRSKQRAKHLTRVFDFLQMAGFLTDIQEMRSKLQQLEDKNKELNQKNIEFREDVAHRDEMVRRLTEEVSIFYELRAIICQRHGLVIPHAGSRSYVTGSIHGWSRSHLTYYTGCLLTRRAQLLFNYYQKISSVIYLLAFFGGVGS